MRPEDAPVGPCPDDEALAALIERRLAETELARLERHLATCPSCLDVVAAMLPPADAVSAGAEPASAIAEPASVVVEEHPPRSAVTTARPSRPRRWRRLAMAASVALVGAGLGVAALNGALGSRAVPRLTAIASRLLGVPFHAGAVTVGLGPDATSFVVRVRQVVFGDRTAPWATAEEIGMMVALAAPLSGEELLREVRVTHPDVDLVGRDPRALIGSRAARTQVLAALAADRLVVVEGRVLLAGPNGATLAVAGVNGGVEREGEAIRLAFQGRVAAGTIDLTGHGQRDTADLSLTLGGRTLDAAALPLLGERLRGTMEFRLDVSAAGEVVRADGRAALQNGRWVGAGPARTMALSPGVRSALGAIDPTHGGNDLVFEEARAAFAWHHGTWRLPRIFVTSRGVVAGGRAQIGAGGVVSGHGTVRLPADLLTALEPHEPRLSRFRDGSGAATLPFGVTGSLATPALTLGRP